MHLLQEKAVNEEVGKQWLARYSNETRKAFIARGNGTWAPLAESTVKKRRKQSDVPLRNNGILLSALSLGNAGNHAKIIENGVEYGFSDSPYPGSNKTIRQIAVMHDQGLGNNPKRQILNEPTENLIQSMAKDLVRSLEKRAPK
jgi:hypothetical protein